VVSATSKFIVQTWCNNYLKTKYNNPNINMIKVPEDSKLTNEDVKLTDEDSETIETDAKKKISKVPLLKKLMINLLS